MIYCSLDYKLKKQPWKKMLQDVFSSVVVSCFKTKNSYLSVRFCNSKPQDVHENKNMDETEEKHKQRIKMLHRNESGFVKDPTGMFSLTD